MAPHITLANRLFGQHGQPLVKQWLEQQLERINDPHFARLFSDNIKLQGIAQGDYNHRLVHTSKGALLGGIRFYGGDTTRPFVEVMAHTFDSTSEGMLALASVVKDEWSMFTPLQIRLLVTPIEQDMLLQMGLGAVLDLSIHVAPHAQMTPEDGRVKLVRFNDVDEAIALTTQRYADIASHDPVLHRNLSPADSDDILTWHNDGHMHAIDAQGDVVGLLAIAPGSIAWIEGDEIEEEVIASAHTGNAYAASAQAAWAAAALDKKRVMVGTIDRLNHASRRTAQRAGRPTVLSYLFMPLP